MTPQRYALAKLVSLETVSLAPISTSATMRRPIVMKTRFALTMMAGLPAPAMLVTQETALHVLRLVNHF